MRKSGRSPRSPSSRRAGARPPPLAGQFSVEIPGRGNLAARHLFLDYNGTLAVGGRLLPPVRRRLAPLAELFEITVLTADTFGSVRRALDGLPASVEIIATGKDKARAVRARARDGVVAIGNGANDVLMLREAALGLAVVGPEGMAPRLLAAADVVVQRIEDGLDLLLDPTRLVATLRR